MKTECPGIRESLQDIYDENRVIPEEIHNHIKTCPGCREYHSILVSLGESLAGEIDKTIDSMPPPDFKAIYRKKKHHTRKVFLPVAWGMAAVMVFSLGLLFHTLFSSRQRKAEYISMEVKMFVSDMFSRPILYGDTGQMHRTGSSGWFDYDILGETSSYRNSVDMNIYFLD